MADKVIRPERRRLVRHQGRLVSLGEVVGDAWSERRTHCWDLEPDCTEARRKRCSAHFVRRNCWDLWAAEYFPPGRKPCCHNDLDCSECAVATAKFGGSISVYVEVPSRLKGDQATPRGNARAAAYCPSLYSIKEPLAGRGDGETRVAFRCHRRPGVMLHGTYVSEVCGSVDHRECNFYVAD